MADDRGGGEGAVAPLDRGAALRETGAALLLLAFATATTVTAFTFGPEARRLPLVVGVPLTIMASINMFFVVRNKWFRRPGGVAADPVPVGPSQAASDAEEKEQAAALREAQASAGSFEESDAGLSIGGALAALATVTALFMFFGLIPAAVLFTTGYMRLVGRESWARSLAVSAVLILLFWLFRTLLNVRFYEGWLAAEEYIPYVLPF